MRHWLIALGMFVGFVAPDCAVAQDPTHLWRVSVDSSGREGSELSSFPSISGDGRFVAFGSASRFASGDVDDKADIYVKDRRTGAIAQVSVDSSGVGANNGCLAAAISANGRVVAFQSPATNLVPGDTNGWDDIFVHDLDTGTTTRISVSTSGQQGDNPSRTPTLSADGRFVAFSSTASTLVPNDRNASGDAFLHDRSTGTTTRISVDSSGNEGDGHSCIGSRPVVSGNGQFVAFSSQASNLVPNDTNGWDDIFVYDRIAGTNIRVSVDSSGTEADDRSVDVTLSANGRVVAFQSRATNLVPNDMNGDEDIFVHDLTSGLTTRISVDSAGSESDRDSSSPAISGDGRIVAFESRSTNLVSGDTNGTSDIFIHDRETTSTVRISTSVQGQEGNRQSDMPTLTVDGRLAAFHSQADNLVPADTNDATDVFVHGPHLILESDTATTTQGSPLMFTTWTGFASRRALLAVVAVNGSVSFATLSLGHFDAIGEWPVAGFVPPGLAGNTLTFQAYGFDPTGVASSSNVVPVEFR